VAEPTAHSATYRLQLHAGFGFADAARIVGYLAGLGVTHLYLSPILQAAPGSMHGYDVVDHTRVSDDLGGAAGLDLLAATAHEHGLGIVVDIVPNHMAVPTPVYLNRPLWTVLRDGRTSAAAGWFDVDWDLCDGRFGLPILGGPLSEVLAARELTLTTHGDEPVIRYYEQVLPVGTGTTGGSVADVLARQHYVLADWRAKEAHLSYRRFFDVDTLIGIRVERPEVFEASHALLIDLHRSGVVDGFRVDHPDGLADPQGYLDQLQRATGGAWVVVEKILTGDEQLPGSWACAGTTGYDAIKVVTQALAPPVGPAMTRRWVGAGGDPDLPSVEVEAKRQVVDQLLAPELARLVRGADAARTSKVDPAPVPAGVDSVALRAALAELLVNSDVYRAYIRPGHPVTADSAARLAGMADRARRARPDISEAVNAAVALVGHEAATGNVAWHDLVVRFQQTTGPVMAKGVEDTTFYRWHRMLAFNEVGGDPLALDEPGPAGLYAWARRQQRASPHGMTGLSTHDTKRSEDVRSRLLAVAEDLDGWDAVWRPLRAEARRVCVDEPTAYLMAQTVLGTWPIDDDRLFAYVQKAVREAKLHTSWTAPDEDYEDRVRTLAGAATSADGPIRPVVQDVLAANAEGIRALTLGTKLLQLVLPGVADTYQGTELVDLSLVDPDNRRPVDFDERMSRLRALNEGEPPRDLDDEKLLVTMETVRLRRRVPAAFADDAHVAPLASTSQHAVGLVRGGRVAAVATREPRALARTGWQEATLAIPAGIWHERLADRPFEVDGELPLGDLLDAMPVALLERVTR
jgi:(1->4)-alpha-D-glucan 1-alpha-D-glucosylmutase